MKIKKSFVFISFLLMFMLFANLVMAKTYIVGTSADFPPFEYVEEGKYVGFDIELIKEIGKLKGFDVEVRDLSFDSLIPALKTGNIDIVIAAMTITDERKEVVELSRPYYSANQSVIVREGSGANLTVLFGNKNIGVQTGTTGDLWVTENLEETGILTGTVKRYDTFVYVINDLINGNIDAVVLDTPVAQRYSELRPVEIVAEIFTGEEYGIAVDKGNTQLINLINEGIEEIIEKGIMDKLIDKYF
ncbi:MAG: basic amino acid ABC transporter substrate-binding protein [Halanaerobiales bacterium]|jgi:polar amino acid transport system substrate-binding protein